VTSDANDRYRALVEAIGEMVWTTSAEGEGGGPRPAWCAYTGQSEAESQGFGWSKAVHPDDAQPTIDAWLRAVAARKKFVFEHRVRRHDGVYRWFEVRAVPVLEADGTIREWVGLHRDIDDEKHAAAQLTRERFAAEEASRVKDEFLAMLGHELRNPLSPILTAVQLLKLRRVEAREVDVIERQAQHLTRLLEDLLDVSRITRGKIALNKEAVELADVAAAAVEMASPVIDRGRHTLTTEIPTHGLAIHADPVRMAQVIANLLTNAAKYTPPGGRIVLRAARRGGEVVLSVEDTGEGISAELLPCLFDMFVQSRQTLARSQGGLGLGLTIVKSLVTMHGGAVSAHSEGRGRGSTFVVRLPAVTETAKFHEASATAIATKTGLQRVLVVDDNADFAEMLADAVGAFGYRTAIAHDGVEALKVAQEFVPHIALVDIGLPVMDGYELAGRLRCQRQDLTLLAITGYGQESDWQRARDAGFQVHITKPVELTSLYKLLNEVAAQGQKESATACDG
jgi:PAS domain S-box-containing protein